MAKKVKKYKVGEKELTLKQIHYLKWKGIC
jgi:hypothetical protein